MGTRYEVLNNVTGTLNIAAGTGDTTVTLDTGHGARFSPASPSASNPIKATFIDVDAGLYEIVHITNVAGDVLTIARAQEGTTALAFPVTGNGSTISIRMTKGLIEAMAQKAADETITGDWNFTGTVGVGIASPDGTVHVHVGSAGSVTANTGADALVLERGQSTGLSILVPDTANANIMLGSPSDNVGASIVWNHDSDQFKLGPNKSSGFLSLLHGNGIEGFRMTSTGDVRIGASGTPQGKLEVTEASSGATSDALVLSNPTASVVDTGVALHFDPNGAGALARTASIRSIQSSVGNHADLRFFTAAGTTPAEAFRIQNGGSINILGGVKIGGTAGDTPATTFHVVSTADSLALIESTDANAFLALKDDSTASDTTVRIGAIGDDMSLRAHGLEYARLAADGINILDDVKIGGSAGDTPASELEIESNAANGSTVGPELTLVRDDGGNGAANDFGGALHFVNIDDAGARESAARIYQTTSDAAAAGFDATLRFQTAQGGVPATRVQIGGGLWMSGATGGDQGAGTINASGYSSDGTPGVTAGPFTTISSITVENGLITAIAGS